jgi:hypothetical protein
MEEKALIQEINLPLSESKGWMKLLGVVLIIQGALTALTIIGILFCWLPIWLGILLIQAAGASEKAQLNGEKIQLSIALQKIKTYFVIHGILMLIMLVGLGIVMLFAGGALIALVTQSM